MAIPVSVQEKVKRFDKDLRLVEKRTHDPEKAGGECILIALERKDRGGVYRQIGWVRPDLLGDGSILLNKLKNSDIREYGGGHKAADAYDEADRQREEKQKAERRDRFDQIGRQSYDHIKRRTGQRINNAGMPQGV
ncbi:MAG: hypothetical protein K0S79_87 [Nitrospira sp.]|jgi:hypothetical protein|nr:hypothetical protein [Nitrospira sp.]